MSKRLRSPLHWYGGKGMLVAKLLPLIPPHHTYVEVFGGGASLLFAKKPSPVEVYNDIDEGLVNFFRVLRNPEQFEQFHRLVCLTPYSRLEYKQAKKTYKLAVDPVERAYLFFIVARMSFGGRWGSGWGFDVTRSSNNMAGACTHWLSVVEQLPEVAQRLLRVQIECKPWENVLATFDTEDTFFYLDPPYMPNTLRKVLPYVTMSEQEHRRLLSALKKLKGKALLSGYPTDLYRAELVDWNYKEFKTVCHAAGRTRESGLQGAGAVTKYQPRTECVWYNYDLPEQQKLFPVEE